MKQPLFTGVCTALVTPFTEDGIDTNALTRLVEWQIEHGVSALLACGTTGEPSTLEDREWALAVDTVIQAANRRVPVIAGTGGNNTAQVIRLAKQARSLGADAQLCVTPYYNKTTQQGLQAHFTAIAEDGSLPLILYHVPARTGLLMAPETVAALAGHPMVIGMKEASGDLALASDMMRLSGDRIAFYSGADEVTVPLMALGALGVISVLSNVAPALTAELAGRMLSGQYREAAALQFNLMPLIHALFREVNPIPAKAALSMMGRCQDRLRLPLVPMGDANRALLKQELEALGLLSQAS